jgi:hypothetical protein
VLTKLDLLTPREGDTVSRFFVRALLWFALALAIWYALRGLFTAPPGWIAGRVMQLVFPWATGAEMEAGRLVLLTKLRVFDAARGMGELAPDVNPLSYCYGVPLLVALVLAARAHKPWRKIAIGIVALLPFQVWGICFAWLAQLVGSPSLQTQTSLGPWALNAIAAGYQLGFLILPTLAPVGLWLAMDRDLVRRFMAEDALSGSLERR